MTYHLPTRRRLGYGEDVCKVYEWKIEALTKGADVPILPESLYSRINGLGTVVSIM